MKHQITGAVALVELSAIHMKDTQVGIEEVKRDLKAIMGDLKELAVNVGDEAQTAENASKAVVKAACMYDELSRMSSRLESVTKYLNRSAAMVEAESAELLAKL